jgi:hypothetical protein
MYDLYWRNRRSGVEVEVVVGRCGWGPVDTLRSTKRRVERTLVWFVEGELDRACSKTLATGQGVPCEPKKRHVCREMSLPRNQDEFAKTDCL